MILFEMRLSEWIAIWLAIFFLLETHMRNILSANITKTVLFRHFNIYENKVKYIISKQLNME